MNELYAVAQRLQESLTSKGWAFCFIGAVAVQRWGEPRLTADVDACVFTGIDGDEMLISDLLEDFEPRRPDAATFALQSRVLLIQSGNIGCDVSLGALDFEESMISRSSMHQFLPGVILRTCSAEDLIVMKSFAGRPKDWLDVEGILMRSGARLDLRYVRTCLGDLCRAIDAPEKLQMFEEILRRQ